jgi:transcriptional regulator with XRE-family HTH domain
MALPLRGSHVDFGTRLRTAREERGVTLRDIAQHTKISVGTLEALERNDASRLPGGIFSRSYVRAYALEVGLDTDRTVREFVETFPEYAAPADIEPAVAVTFDDRRSSRGLVAVALLAVAVLGGIPGWRWWQSHRSEALSVRAASLPAPVRAVPGPPPAAAPALVTDAGPGKPVPGRGQPPAPVQHTAAQPAEVSQAAIVGLSDEPPPAAVPLPEPAPESMGLSVDAVKVALHPLDACWVRVTVGGRVRLSRVMLAGEREEFETTGAVFLEVGNAAALAYSLNGEPGRALGAAGQVVRATIRRETIEDFIAR